jgi:integrase
VRFSPKAELFLPATKTKTKADRRIPISSVLRPILERRRLDPAGAIIPSEGYVFGDEIGRPRDSCQTAWEGVFKRAKITDLHFHDLRREAGSKWMDAGIPLATIQRWLDTRTSRRRARISERRSAPMISTCSGTKSGSVAESL